MTATICACRRPNSWFRASCALVCVSGCAPIADAGRLAAGAVLSGPAGGIAGSLHAARLLGEGNLIPFDMGGTSTDISLIVGSRPSLVTSRRVAGHTIALNSLDIASIGAGGG